MNVLFIEGEKLRSQLFLVKRTRDDAALCPFVYPRGKRRR
jgi:hypothetical protein